jgi:signal transduction histidine kinase/DNA-binding response OmpR family regulator
LGVSVHDHCFGANYAHLYRQGHYYVIDDIAVKKLTGCYEDIFSKFQIQANLVMPLLCGNQLWGLLCIHQCSDKRHWQETEINLVKQLASQLAIAIQQANLFEQLQQEQQRLTTSNERLAMSNAELARATRLKDEFLANMSHELRTPLNAIMGMTEGLQERIFGQINPQQSKAVETIERSSSHLLELINDILDVAKIESGQLELNRSYTSIPSLCQSSLSFIKQLALKKRIQIKTNIPANLPEIFIDERRIRQVLINLLNNAVKFTPSGGSVILDVCLINLTKVDPPQTDYLRLAVIDTGIGIAPENINKLFQPFVQVDSALNRQYQGTGLGLTLVRQLVELHGGQIGVISEVDVGSCFTIDLPVVQSNLCLSCTLSPGKQLPDFSGSDQELFGRILLVEDNEANINTISSYLQAKGYQLLFAKNGQEGIDLAKSAVPDLILMDVQMPEMDGLEAIKQIRSDPCLKDIPIIALTALAMDQDGPLCLSAGADVYLTKPTRPEEILAVVRNLMRRHDRHGASALASTQVWTLHQKSMSLSAPDSDVLSLTPKESVVLFTLAQTATHCTYEDLLGKLGGESPRTTFDKVRLEVLISRLRSKLFKFKGQAFEIKTIHGSGYRLSRPLKLRTN